MKQVILQLDCGCQVVQRVAPDHLYSEVVLNVMNPPTYVTTPSVYERIAFRRVIPGLYVQVSPGSLHTKHRQQDYQGLDEKGIERAMASIAKHGFITQCTQLLYRRGV